MKLAFCNVVVHIETGILLECHFDSCESSRDMAFSATWPLSCPGTRSKLSVSTVARSWFSSSLSPPEMTLILLSLFDPSVSTEFNSQSN